MILKLLSSLVIVSFIGCGGGEKETTYNNKLTQQQVALNINLPNDTTAPVITIIGDNTLRLKVKETFNDLGATAIDDIDGVLTTSIIATSDVNTNIVGNYTVVYRVSDSSGNQSSLTRHVSVEPTQNDEIIYREHISLTVGISEKLNSIYQNLNWSSNSPFVTVDQSGNIFALADKTGENSRAIIKVVTKDGTKYDTCDITIVNWRANLSTLSIEAMPSNISELITKDGITLYFSSGSTLYTSTNGLETRQHVGNIPTASEQTPVLIKTPYSHYLRVDNKIFESNNLTNYSEILTSTSNPLGLTHATKHPGLNHAFSYDAINKYIYAGEYTLDKNNMHAVYRGTITPTGLKQWKKVYEFDSANSDSVHSVLHIHVVTVDPYTGDVWIGTGDNDNQARLYYSKDHGDTWKLFAIGAQYFRILSMWFTPNYVYWNTDSADEEQVISRTRRTKMEIRNLTPRVETGQTKVGVRYFIYKSDGLLPTEGTIYTESHARQLSLTNIVYAIDDSTYDYREIVAKLANGSHWYHMWVKDDLGEDLVIMSTAPEGEKRDKRARMFGIKEKSNGSVDVQELLSFGKANSRPYSTHMQFEPGFQDDDGFIYFKGRATEHRIYKTKLHWKDQ